MIPTAFEYLAPKSLEEALRILAQHGDEAKILAGGHSLLPLMKLRLSAPRFVIDIGRLRGLDQISVREDRIHIGALVTHADILASPVLRAKCNLLPETAYEIGDVQVRNRGTIGGSLAHADPAADYPASILALDAELIAASAEGTRTIAAAEFFVDLLTTQLRPGEMLTEVRVPFLPAHTGAAYLKLHQPASGFAVVGAAAVLTLGPGGKMARVAVGMTGVGAIAYRATAVEQVLVGKQPSEKLLASACRAAAQGVEPLSDLHASAEYRREMAAVFARRALERAIARAQGKRA